MAGKGSAPGERRGGRVKGTPNRLAQTAADIFAAAGFDPLAEMVKNSARTYEHLEKARRRLEAVELEDLVDGDGSQVVSMLRLVRDFEATYDRQCIELAQYAHPKRKAIEYTGSGGGPMQMAIQVSFVAPGVAA